MQFNLNSSQVGL